MDSPPTPTTILRVDSRYRHRPQNLPHQDHPAPALHRREDESPPPSPDGESNGRENMSRGHRFFHRRAAQGNTKVVTVAVEVVATVDGNGSLVAQETLAPVTPQPSNQAVAAAAATTPAALPSNKSAAPPAQQPLPSAAELPLVPSVPSIPTVALPAVPSVPAVPPFPSYLNVPTVPAYPFSTGNPVVQVAATSDPVSASPAPTPIPDTAVAPSTLLDTPPLSVSSSPANTTSSSTASVLPSYYSFSSSSAFSFTSLDTISASTSTELVASIAAVPSRSASTSQSLPSSSSTSSAETSTSSQSAVDSIVITSDTPTPTAYDGSWGTDAPGTAAAPAATTAVISGSEADSSPSPLETPKVVGSVVGSLAGAALILAIILLLLRRHKRKRGGALQLTGDDRTDNNQSMRQAPSTANSLAPIAFLNRFSGLSGKTAETSLSGGERSFQRVSGRKLPSAFSEGMTSDQFSRGGTLSGSSFYQDDHGVYGGAAVSKEFGKEIGDTSTTRESGHMNIRPSPARTPVIRHPDDGNPFATDRNYLSPPQSPNSDRPPRGTLGRSLPSADGSRSSRFTENV